MATVGLTTGRLQWEVAASGHRFRICVIALGVRCWRPQSWATHNLASLSWEGERRKLRAIHLRVIHRPSLGGVHCGRLLFQGHLFWIWSSTFWHDMLPKGYMCCYAIRLGGSSRLQKSKKVGGPPRFLGLGNERLQCRCLQNVCFIIFHSTRKANPSRAESCF